MIVGLPALVAAAVFANTLQNGFTYDDQTLVPRMLTKYADASWWYHLTHWRGLTYATFRIDDWLWGTWTPGFHLTNVVFHSLASALSAYAAWVLFRSARIAVVCGLLFAVHPVHVEAVASWAFRKDVLAMLFAMLAFILWVRIRQAPLRYAGTIVCLWLAFVSKEVAAVGVIPMLFLADLLPKAGSRTRWPHLPRRAMLRSAPLLIFGLLATVKFSGDLREFLTTERIREMVVSTGSYDQVLATAAASTPDVLRLMFFPRVLCAVYPSRLQASMNSPRAQLGAAAALSWVLLVVLLMALRRAPYVAFAMAWVALTYLPISNVVPLTKFFVADRYLYVPSFGVCLLVTIGFEQALAYAQRRDVVWLQTGIRSLLVLLIAAAGVRSFVRNQDWHDDYELWSSAIRAGCATPRAHINLGNILLARGKLDEAISQYRQALKINPRHATGQYNLGNVMKAKGKYVEAIEHYTEALRIKPDYVKARVNLGRILVKQGKIDEAIRHYREALRIQPDHIKARSNLGVALIRQGKMDEAIRHYTDALELNPTIANDHYNLGAALLSKGKIDEAIRHYRETLQIQPDHVKGHLNLGRALMRQGKVDEAIVEYREVLRIRPNHVGAHQALEDALAERAEDVN